MATRFTTPSLPGLGLNRIALSTDPAVKQTLGTVFTADDGHDYILAKASAGIASAAVCILTEPAMTMATGAGAWTAPTIVGGVPSGATAWFKKTAI
ncbi:hypothetical protein J1C56_09055 [Aminobacter anthyllidis]|uniref:Uncharacterized protein n=1 Tax=Aminobacter anthyllidis TaxID=1035067 RepID=A0A9X1A9G4_9HYPH|nr:hypothetical protein [Aminobacter anthyllidis]MBT1155739.1 hypothetical protein [Aminobacter anthyllidis]